jgi:hypothetical protein
MTNVAKYNVTRMGDEWMLIGYVNVMDGDYLVADRRLPEKYFEDFKDMTLQQIQELADKEAQLALSEESAARCISQYKILKAHGLYIV